MTATELLPRTARARAATPAGQAVVSGVLRVDGPVPLEHGGRLERCDIAYRAYGDARHPTIVVLGGISATRHVTACREEPRPGWWEPVVGGGRAIDSAAFRVLTLDYLGGPGGTTGPASHGDAAQFPAISTYDQARAVAALLDHLGVVRAHAVIGASYGGMVALAFASRFGTRLSQAVVISAAHESHPMATALRALQRDVVRLGLATGRVREALQLARGIAMTTYRTPEELASRFSQTPAWTTAGARFPVEDYLAHCGNRFADTFTPQRFLALSTSLDLHRVDAATIAVPTSLVSVDSDALVPPWQMRALRDALGAHASWHPLTSARGHDAFLADSGAVSAILSTILRTRAAR